MIKKQWLPSLLFAFFVSSCGKKSSLEVVKTFPGYPSSSGIEKINKDYYIIGDDAKNILILDSSLLKKDSISLYPFSKQRMPKSIKADLESIMKLNDNQLLILGSGSASPYRNAGWLVNVRQREKQFIHLDTFYHRFSQNGIQDVNIEGACIVQNKWLLANRGHAGYPHNYLIVTKPYFWQQQQAAPIEKISIGQPSGDSSFRGISGLAYAKNSDQLLMSVSTEATNSTTADGAIGKSYIWIIQNITSKLGWQAINPNKIIDLNQIDARFKGQKIESIHIDEETKSSLKILLVADNDNGVSTVFVLMLIKE